MEYLFRQKDDYEDSTALVRFQADGIVEITVKFREFLLASGYHPNVVDEYVPDPYSPPTECGEMPEESLL